MERQRIPYAAYRQRGDGGLRLSDVPDDGGHDFGPMFMRFRRLQQRRRLSLHFPPHAGGMGRGGAGEMRTSAAAVRRTGEKLREAGPAGWTMGPCRRGSSRRGWELDLQRFRPPRRNTRFLGCGSSASPVTLGELLTDLKDPPGGEQFVESLNRYFGNVRAAMQGPEGSGALLARRSIVFARNWTRRRRCGRLAGEMPGPRARPGDLPAHPGGGRGRRRAVLRHPCEG